MVASPQNHDVVPFDEIREPMFLVDTARPGASEDVTELLRLANTCQGGTSDVIKQSVDALQRRPVPILDGGKAVPAERSATA